MDLRDVVGLLSPLSEHAHHSDLLVNKVCLIPQGSLITRPAAGGGERGGVTISCMQKDSC